MEQPFLASALFSLVGIGDLVMPGFVAGKLISIVCGTALVYVTYHIARCFSEDKKIALLAQVFTALCPPFFLDSFNAHNHMLDALLFNLTLLTFLRSINAPTNKGFVTAGILGGLASMARFTSITLLSLCTFWLFNV